MMRQNYQKIILLETVTLIGAILCCLIAVFQKVLLLFILTAFLLALNLTCHALILWHTYRTEEAIKQSVRTVLILLLVMFFILYK